MNTKITKLREEYQKNKVKISERQARSRDLERQIRELENTEIVGLVRAQGFTPEQLAALLQTLKAPVFPEREESSEDETS